MRFRYAKTTQIYVYELTEVLYNKHYFGFKDSAINYVNALLDRLKATIHIKQKSKSPPCFSQYGQHLWYVSYTKSKRTTWYFFFTYHPNEDIYFIRYITNNHVAGHLLE
ncbi:MAG: hypothetical protein LUG18_11520 [Candidatus Azobacteroides sp.]|nr:hypothetical protein [Candidatus Azobacteroides sp.]